jgi:glutathione S-transferase
MKLYFNPLACSLAARIALYETAQTAELIEVDSKTKRTSDGRDFRTVNPLGLVPTLELDDGSVLTENAAVLQLLAPRTTPKLQQWLSFIGTELHKQFVPLLDKTAPPEVKAYAEGKVRARLAHVNEHLSAHPYLLGEDFTVADGYLFAILNWTAVAPVKLAEFPALAAFHARMLARPAVARAFGEERTLYTEELKRAS